MHKVGEIALVYWAHVITILLGMIVCAALSVPLLTYLGLDALAKPLFFSLHLICAQIPSHSFYILGHQLGMCARNMGIYTSMFLGGLLFLASKKRLPGIPWWIWLLMILPMAYDGLTQMFGLRESTWELRVLTGTLFGLGNMWFVLPFIQRTLMEMVDTTPPVVSAPGRTVRQAFALPQTPQPVTQPLPFTQTSLPATQPGVAVMGQQADLATPFPLPQNAQSQPRPTHVQQDGLCSSEASLLPEE
jgi:uncharacterized membrane protein